jgi:nucleotide-binding universal stress UspA family protein
MDTRTQNDAVGPPEGAVVVGIDLDGSPSALAFAAEEAVRTLCALHLVHVVRISGPEAYVGAVEGAYEAADASVRLALEHARELVADRVPVTVEQVDGGGLVADLVDRGERGSMLVLEHRRLSRIRRFVTGSVVSGAAARCPVPLVSVPQGWRPTVTESVVTVGVQDADEAASLIRRGLVEARARGARVEVLHAWYLGGGYDPVVIDSEVLAEQEHRVAQSLAPAIDVASREVPGVPHRLRVQHSEPTAALLERAASSQLLVIGRRHHLLPLGSHLGPVARTVLHHCTAPVLLNPETPPEVPVVAEDTTPALGLAPA